MKRFAVDMMRVWRNEFGLVLGDMGVMLFFFILPLGYPLVYTIIYNTELVREVPVAVVDHGRTAFSRNFVRMVDAAPEMTVYDYASDMAQARRMWAEHKVYGILELPEDFGRKATGGGQATGTFYSDMSLLLRYRGFTSALTRLQLAAGAQVQQQKISDLGLLAQTVTGNTGTGSALPVNVSSEFLGDPTQGFASFIIPGILILILQQSLLLGATTINGGVRERRRANGGVDPRSVAAGALATIWGKTLCYVVLYMPLLIYVLYVVPWIFSLPQVGSLWHQILLVLPMLIGASFMAQALGGFVSERETSMLVVVFTSVVFLFMSGLTWPRFAMNGFWQLISGCIPATWGIEGFIRMNSNGASLWEQAHTWNMLWILAGVWMMAAWAITGLSAGRDLRVGVSARV